MQKKLRIFITIFLILCNSPVASAQGDRLKEMTKVCVNGFTVELDSQSVAKILGEVTKYLGQEAIVIQPAKNGQPASYSWKLKKLNDRGKNLPEILRVLVDKKPVIDSQIRTELTSAIMGAVQAGKKVEITPKAVHEKMLIVEDAVRTILELAEQGKLPDSKQVGIGSTLNDIISAFGYPHNKVDGFLPHTTHIFYTNNNPKNMLDRIDFVYSNKQKKVTYLSSEVTYLFEQKEPLTDHDLFKLLGTPYKTRKTLSAKEMAKITGVPEVRGLTIYPVHTFKVGAYYLHFSKAEITDDSTSKDNHSVREVIVASIDKKGNSLTFLLDDGSHPPEIYNQRTPCWVRK